MRGKLRDKSSINRRDILRRPDGEQRQPYKRDARGTQWIGQQPEDDDDDFDFENELDIDEREEEELENASVLLKETQKK